MSNHSCALLIAALCLGVSAPQAAALELGKNLAGEACRTNAAPSPDAPMAIICAARSDADGEVGVVPIDRPLPREPNAHRDAMQRLIRFQHEDEQLDCSDPQWIGTPGVLLRICSLKSNGWPRIVLGVEAGGKLYRAEGPPSLLPVLEAAIASDAHATLLQADEGALQQAVQAKFSEGVLHASAADYASYNKYIEDARLAGATDNYGAAEADYRQALAIEERLFGRDAAVVGQTLAELGLQVSNQGRSEEAAALFRRARTIIEASAASDARARLDSYMALDAANGRHYVPALAFAGTATAARQGESGTASEADSRSDASEVQAPAADREELVHSLRLDAEMSLKLGDVARARASAEEALWIVSEEPGLPLWWRADTVALIGEVNEAQGRAVHAEHDFRDARDLDAILFGDAAPTARADLRLGEFYTRQQLYPAAVDAFRAGFAIAKKDQTTRTQVQPDDVVQFILADTAAGNGGDSPERNAEIFRASQFSKSGVTDQAIARIAAREAAGDSALSDLIGRAQTAERDRDRARVELAAEYAKMDDERNATREGQLDANVKLASATADDLLTKVRASFPQYANLAKPEPAELADVQARLAVGEALVLYTVGPSSGYALLVKPNSFQAVSLPIGQDALAADIADLRRALTPALGRVGEFSLRNSHALYQQLIAPLEGPLAGVSHLIVVPGAALSNLPFGVLVSQAPNNGAEHDYAHANWLVRRFALSEVPSPRAFLSLRDASGRRVAPSRPFLGVGAPAFHGAINARTLADLASACRQEGPIAASLLRALPALPGTAAEVQTIASRLGGGASTVLLGAQATEGNFRAEPLDQYAVIYFATHGLLPGELHCAGEPALVLSPPDRPAADTKDDGLLNASEIAQLKLDADLVVLSACNTAEDANKPGGGSLAGLSDAFFTAGAHAVLASHWEISSASTTALMTEVFNRVRGGAGVAEALRQSQLSLLARSSTAHPFHWAAFGLIGDGAALASGIRARGVQTADARQP